jgi:hypothetical protein
MEPNVQALLASMKKQPEIIGTVPTWPWKPGTQRALIATLVLLIFLSYTQNSSRPSRGFEAHSPNIAQFQKHRCLRFFDCSKACHSRGPPFGHYRYKSESFHEIDFFTWVAYDECEGATQISISSIIFKSR